MPQTKDCILVIAQTSQTASVPREVTFAIDRLEVILRKKLTRLVLVEATEKSSSKFNKDFVELRVSSKSPKQLHKAILKYQNRLLAVVCRGEDMIPVLKRVIPHVPYVRTPTETSLDWTTDKLLMRRRLTEFDKKITPQYTVVADVSPESITKIKRKVGFPLIVKPTGLAASVLVSVCYHEDELITTLKRTFRTVKTAHKSFKGRGEPKVLVEEMLEGRMYSIDGYVNSRGKVYYCPPVHVKTGRNIGFDDFFGYLQMTPVKLMARKIKNMEEVVTQGVHALGLRNTTIHAELIKTERQGWKIIEIGARVGGFRHKMYELSYGFNHSLNDIMIRIPKKPIITRKRQGYTAVMKWFAKDEGTLVSLKGIRKVRALSSFHDIVINKQKGDKCQYAKNGGKSVFNLTLHNKSRSELLADIRRTEKNVKIIVDFSKKKK